jgi:diguanylate cyclase (GGDEF)-like protein
MMGRKKKRRRRGARPIDPMAWSPLDRLLGLAVLGLASLLLLLGASVPDASELPPPGGGFGAVTLGLIAVFGSLLAFGGGLKKRDGQWSAFGHVVAATFIVGAGLIVLAVGYRTLPAGILAVATPVVLFGLAQRSPALIAASAWLVGWVLVPGAAAFGRLPSELLGSPEPSLFGVLPALPAAAAAFALSGRALIHFREREGALRRLAAIDELTITANRRFFFEHCQREVARAVRYGRPVSVLMVDVQGLRIINESLGHAAGDGMLKSVALALRAALRTHDLVGRYGDTLFALLLPETDREGAGVVAERCLARVRGLTADEDLHGKLRLDVSVGVATFPTSGVSNLDQLITSADLAVAAAIEAGRNVVHTARSRKSSVPDEPPPA